MGKLRNSIFSLIDYSALQMKNLIENVDEGLLSFNVDSCLDTLNKKRSNLLTKGNELMNDVTKLLKQVADNLTDFSVTVPYDKEKGEKLSYEIKENKLEINVTYQDDNTNRSTKTEVVIPENCDLEKVSVKENSKRKIAIITIAKKTVINNNQRDTEDTHSQESTSETDLNAPLVSENHNVNQMAQTIANNANRCSRMMEGDRASTDSATDLIDDEI